MFKKQYLILALSAFTAHGLVIAMGDGFDSAQKTQQDFQHFSDQELRKLQSQVDAIKPLLARDTAPDTSIPFMFAMLSIAVAPTSGIGFDPMTIFSPLSVIYTCYEFNRIATFYKEISEALQTISNIEPVLKKEIVRRNEC